MIIWPNWRQTCLVGKLVTFHLYGWSVWEVDHRWPGFHSHSVSELSHHDSLPCIPDTIPCLQIRLHWGNSQSWAYGKPAAERIVHFCPQSLKDWLENLSGKAIKLLLSAIQVKLPWSSFFFSRLMITEPSFLAKKRARLIIKIAYCSVSLPIDCISTNRA